MDCAYLALQDSLLEAVWELAPSQEKAWTLFEFCMRSQSPSCDSPCWSGYYCDASLIGQTSASDVKAFPTRWLLQLLGRLRHGSAPQLDHQKLWSPFPWHWCQSFVAQSRLLDLGSTTHSLSQRLDTLDWSESCPSLHSFGCQISRPPYLACALRRNLTCFSQNWKLYFI